VSVVQPGHKVGDKFGIPQNEIPFKVETEHPVCGTLENDGQQSQHEVNEERKVEAICRKPENDGPHEVNDERKVQAICRKPNSDRQNEANDGQKRDEEDLVINSNHENDGQHEVNDGESQRDQALDSTLENGGQNEENEANHEVNEVGENKKKEKKMKPKCARASCENQGRHRCSRCKAVYYCVLKRTGPITRCTATMSTRQTKFSLTPTVRIQRRWRTKIQRRWRTVEGERRSTKVASLWISLT